MTDRKDIFRQSQCTVCHGFYYDEEVHRDDSGRCLCHHCYINSFASKASFVSKINIDLPIGMNLFQLLMVIGIIGIIVGIVVPNIIRMRDSAAERALMAIYYENQGTQLGSIAEEVIAAYEEGHLEEKVTELPQLSDISPEEFQQLETDLSDCVDIDTEELKLAKAMQALMDLQWYEDELDQFD